jgi:hypothetical protein
MRRCCDFLEEVVNSFRLVTIFIEGLDESVDPDGRDGILAILGRLSRRNVDKVRLFLSSRDHVRVSDSIDDLYAINVCATTTKEDLYFYIQNEVRMSRNRFLRNTKVEPEQRNLLERELIEALTQRA